MKCFGGSSEGKQTSKKIDKDIEKWFKNYDRATKILLLGAGEAGKTTILKQMKILHINGFSKEEKLDRALQIKKNIHEAATELAKQLEPLGLEPGPEAKRASDIILKMGSNAPEFDDEYFDIIATLWSDPMVKECLRRSNEFQLIDSAEYFLERLDTVRDPKYMPEEKDILQCRQRTIGIQKIEFDLDLPKSMGGGCQSFCMYDVGGQRGERKKWLQVFEGIHAVWFLVASSDFDQTLREDNTYNRLRESITLFGDVWNSRFLVKAGLIVFLNKQDILERKIREGRKIENYFPEYSNFKLDKSNRSNDEYIKTREFIKDMLVQMTQKQAPPKPTASSHDIRFENSRPRQCYYHFTVATDTNNIKTVFDDVVNSLRRNNLMDMGML